MKTAIWAALFILAMMSLGIYFQIQKVHNCEDAGWDYHWTTEQCLPKPVK